VQIVIVVLFECELDVFNVGDAASVPAFGTRGAERDHNDRGQDANDGNDHEEFDKGEAVLAHPFSIPAKRKSPAAQQGELGIFEGKN
jgi:hypothetical protein